MRYSHLVCCQTIRERLSVPELEPQHLTAHTVARNGLTPSTLDIKSASFFKGANTGGLGQPLEKRTFRGELAEDKSPSPNS